MIKSCIVLFLFLFGSVLLCPGQSSLKYALEKKNQKARESIAEELKDNKGAPTFYTDLSKAILLRQHMTYDSLADALQLSIDAHSLRFSGLSDKEKKRLRKNNNIDSAWVVHLADSLHQQIFSYVKAERNSNLIRAYVSRFPQNPFKSPLANLEIEIDWDFARSFDSPDGYRTFISMHPETDLVKSARQKMDEASWRIYSTKNTVRSMEDYIREFPQGSHRTEAELAIERMEFEQVASPYNRLGLLNFIDRYPAGKFRGQAKILVDSMDYNSSITGSAESYRNFANRFPDHPKAKMAMAEYCRLLLAEAEDEQSFRAYLKVWKEADCPEEQDAALNAMLNLFANGQVKQDEIEMLSLPQNLNLVKAWHYFKMKGGAASEFESDGVYPASDYSSYNQNQYGNESEVPETSVQSSMTFSEFEENLSKSATLAEALLEGTQTAFGEKVKECIETLAPKQIALQLLAFASQSDFAKKDWKAAITRYEKMRPFFEPLTEGIDSMISLLKRPDNGIRPQRLGSEINTSENEYCPLPGADGKCLYFCGKNRPDNIGGEDMFVSCLVDGKQSKSKPLPYGINKPYSNEAPEAISPDGTNIYIFRNGDFYRMKKIKSGWTEPIKLDNVINSDSWDADLSIGSNGKVILFASDRGPGVNLGRRWDGGDINIYVSISGDFGWSEPIDLGTQINTSFCDRSPFLHPDMKTLYFSSSGHGGLGSSDIFVSRRLDDSWQNWSTPINLGKELNTGLVDDFYKISTRGDEAFFSKTNSNSTYANLDIYKVKLPINLRPETVATISGKLVDLTGQPVEAIMKWEDLESGKDMGVSEVDPTDGSYFIILPVGKNYGYYADGKGFYPISRNVDLRKLDRFREIKENIAMPDIESVKKGKVSVVVNNIFFDFNDFNLKSESDLELNRLAKLLKEHEELKIHVSGHTDAVGTDDYNLSLSKNRAKAVVDYLVGQGIDSGRLVPQGFGRSKPLAPNTTEAGRAKNRRVEIKAIL